MNIGKKLLSLLTVFCLTLSLVPTVALAATQTSTIVIGDYSNGITLGQEKPYLVNNSTTATSVEPQTGGYIYFDVSTDTVELHGYDNRNYSMNRGIYANSGDLTSGSLTIKLFGNNYIKSASNGIYSCGSLIIDGPGSLTLSAPTNGSTIYARNSMMIQDGAKVTVPNGAHGQAIDSSGGPLTITGSGTEVIATGSYIQVKGGHGEINLNDGAKLVAGTLLGSFKINGEGKNFQSGVVAPTILPTYTISGTVKDTSGKPIDNASVQLCTTGTANADTLAVIKVSTTDSTGDYSISGVSTGTYTIKVSKDGYKDSVTSSFTVQNGNVMQDVTLTAITQEPTPSAIFTATGPDCGTLSGVSNDMKYRFGAGDEGTWTEITGVIDGKLSLSALTVTAGNTLTIQIKMPGKSDGSTTDSAVQTITVTKAASPTNLSATPCMVDKTDGTITITNASKVIQYKKKDTSDEWADISGSNISDLSSGTYFVRVKANGTELASESTEVTVDTGYPVWVKATQVTSANMSNVFGDNKVTYTPTTSDNPATLTLNGAYFTNNDNTSGGVLYDILPAGIATTEKLNIVVHGNNTIASTNDCAIRAKKDLTISGDGSLKLDGYDNRRAISLDGTSSTLNITSNVEIIATVGYKNGVDSSGSQAEGITIASPNISIRDSAKLTAVNNGKNWAIYCEGGLAVDDTAVLTARSQGYNCAIQAKDGFTYPGHTVTASTTFDGPSSGESTEPYNPTKLNTYKYVKVEPITVTGVELNKDSLSIKVGQSETLSATLQPSGAVQGVTWTSSDDKIVTVTNGTVTAVGVGTATITVLTKDGGYTDTCTVTVSNPSSSSGSHTTYYPVNTPAKSEGGSVVVSPKSASKGSAVTVTVTPESGYQVSSVQAVDKDGKKLTLTDKGDGKYSFVMPGSKVEVSASFAQVQKPEEPSPYRDVSKDSYYYDAVQWASDKGITNGVSDGVFAPDWVCTRGQIVTFLWRSVGSPAPKTAEMPFADVAEDAYYAQAVLWAVENGITKGTSETTFSPDQTCTRAHAVAFLYRLAGSPAVTGSSFQDVAADAYYNAAVAWAVQQGITNGTSETTFSPDEICTRAQIVTFLYRMDQAK